jgi:hypothetical protein
LLKYNVLDFRGCWCLGMIFWVGCGCSFHSTVQVRRLFRWVVVACDIFGWVRAFLRLQSPERGVLPLSRSRGGSKACRLPQELRIPPGGRAWMVAFRCFLLLGAVLRFSLVRGSTTLVRRSRPREISFGFTVLRFSLAFMVFTILLGFRAIFLGG